MAGHSGVEKTVFILQKHFYWPKLRQDVNKYIKNQGLYTPRPTPQRPWESISMDYMASLPSTKHDNDCVFVVVDRFLKMAIITAYKKRITAEDTAKLFFEWVHFWIPRTITLDQDNMFLNTFWSSV
jgi:hypothetical protein